MLIGELSERSGTGAWSLRYYEKKGIIRGERLENGYRDFGEDQVGRVRAIRCFLRLGMSVGQIEILSESRGCLEERITLLKD